jgi:hypothetical protein
LEEKNNENLQAQMKDVTDKMLKLKGTAYQQVLTLVPLQALTFP